MIVTVFIKNMQSFGNAITDAYNESLISINVSK